MIRSVSIRLTAVLALLVAITLASVAAGHDVTERRTAAAIILGLAFTKIIVVLAEFMEIHHAPVWLKRAAYGWAVMTCLMLWAIYSYGRLVGPGVREMIL